MEANQNFYNEIARRAAAEYGVQDYSLTFIRHSDNVTYKVEKSGSGAYLLRIHVPVTSAMGSHGADVAAVNSELLWLEALSQDTDLVLQRPVRNRTGALVTQIAIEHTPLPVNCTLLHWVDGQPYHRDLETEHTAHQIGEIMAKLHIHASQWKIPVGFKRPARDIGYFERVLREFHPAMEDGRVSPADYLELETSIRLLTEMLQSLAEDKQTHGIMHADAHKGNLLYHNGEIRLIDFSFCAFGNFMFDLGICFSDMIEELRPVCLASYQSWRALPEGYQQLIEGFFVCSMVGTFVYWVGNPRAQEILARKVPQIARDYAARFNREGLFWFSR